MKKLYIFLFVSLMLSSGANAQNYDKFKLGLGAGYAGGKGAEGITDGGGVLLTLEPAYRIIDNMAIGLRLEAALYGSGHSGIPGGFGSITINGQYYFDVESFRPFVGAGLGSYLGSGLSSFGFYPRLGLDWGHFTLAFEYNLIPGSSSDYDYLTNTSNAASAYYLGIRVGGFFFGGKK
jgi:hypothetical protein